MSTESPQRIWRLNRFRYGTWSGGLVGEKCKNGHLIFPPRDIWPEPDCHEEAKELVTIRGEGTVYSYTVVHDAPLGFEAQTPYVVALVRLDDGPMIAAQLTDVDPHQIEIGLKVEMVTRIIQKGGKRGVISYGYKFRLPIRSHV